ncbi:hypothetical protein F5050DRAFT_820075 [Lentinula boryana]|uniref:Uncharacterized protein n=1 Tax=Lentinula boryana TaxID=40481 RepID=A0ABQ8QMX9_9AGAR|nr:hypothetical protein F5050DRAFT_820075 [Lentinula boryana]
MHLNLVYVPLAIVGMIHIATAIPVHGSEHSDSASIVSLTEKKPILVSFGELAGPEGTEENQEVTGMINLLFEEAVKETNGVIPPVKLTFKNHVRKKSKAIAVVPFTFTGLDICGGQCEAQADLFQRISFIKDSTGKILYDRHFAA